MKLTRDTAYIFILAAIALILLFTVMRQPWSPASHTPPPQTTEPTDSTSPPVPTPPPQPHTPLTTPPDLHTITNSTVDQDQLYLGRSMSHWKAMLRHDDPRQRAFAIERVGQIGPQALNLLTWALRDPQHTVRITALRALHRLGTDASPATGLLIDLLTTDPVRDVRLLTISCLGEIGPAAHQALEPLRTIQRDTNITMRIAATTAIKKITTLHR